MGQSLPTESPKDAGLKWRPALWTHDGPQSARHLCGGSLPRGSPVNLRPQGVPPAPVPILREGEGTAVGPPPDAPEELHRVWNISEKSREGVVRGRPPLVHLLGLRDPRGERRRDHRPSVRPGVADPDADDRGVLPERPAVPRAGRHRGPRRNRGRNGPLSPLRDPAEEAD